jgi:hypothetical protein
MDSLVSLAAGTSLWKIVPHGAETRLSRPAFSDYGNASEQLNRASRWS